MGAHRLAYATYPCPPMAPQIVHTLAEEITEPPEDGCFVRGLFIVGARWDSAMWALAEAAPRQLWSPLPVMLLRYVRLRVGVACACPLRHI